MASNLLAMASNLLAMASNLPAMPSNLLALAVAQFSGIVIEILKSIIISIKEITNLRPIPPALGSGNPNRVESAPGF